MLTRAFPAPTPAAPAPTRLLPAPTPHSPTPTRSLPAPTPALPEGTSSVPEGTSFCRFMPSLARLSLTLARPFFDHRQMPKAKKTKAPKKSPSSPSASASIDDLSPAELASRVDEARAHFDAIRALLPGLVSYDKSTRGHAGRLRDGEPAALAAIVAAVRQNPAAYTDLGAVDDGHDDATFEVDLLDARVKRAEALKGFADKLQQLGSDLADTVLDQGERGRSPLLQAYGIAKSAAAANPKVRTTLRPALDFYRKAAVTGAATRAKKAKESATK